MQTDGRTLSEIDTLMSLVAALLKDFTDLNVNIKGKKINNSDFQKRNVNKIYLDVCRFVD